VSGEAWFSTDLEKGLSRVHNNSTAQAFVDAEEYFVDLRTEVEATGEGGQICWIGFEGSGATPMPLAKTSAPDALKALPPRAHVPDEDKSWLELLTAASNDRRVPVRALLNLHPKPDMDPAREKKYRASNLDLVGKLNTLADCLAINDFRYLWLNGTHHQKLVLVYNDRGLSAYVGTCDLEASRIVNRWCEVHCKIQGDVAAELYEVFRRRWIEHTGVLSRVGAPRNRLKAISDMRFTAPSSGNLLIQTSTTYGNPERRNPFLAVVAGQPPAQLVNQRHAVSVRFPEPAADHLLGVMGVPRWFGNDFFSSVDPAGEPLIAEAARQNRTYAFAPHGHTGIYHAVKKAIENTSGFIYLEDQYLVCDERMGSHASVLELLVAKVKQQQFKKLVVFCTRIDDINDEFQRTGWKHRNSFVRSLLEADRDKVVVCQYKSRRELRSSFGKPHESAFYIHSKTWVFDDQYLITGSANCNRRGYSHDSELDVGVYDQDQQFVRDLRVRLWMNRLNTTGITKAPIAPGQLTDFLSAVKYWESPSQYGLTIESSREKSLAPIEFPDLDFASYKAMVTGAPMSDKRLMLWIEALKMTGLWDHVVDPDGT
jgi:phosphatidylserine/phosphatidylglycerophosphate/cardiolipin synthase-like enzyme